jgi:hypothetical protein
MQRRLAAKQLNRLATIIDSHPDWWRFPEDAPVRGFLGTDQLFIVGDQPSTSPWPPSNRNRRIFYELLTRIGASNAHLTDLYKKRGRSGHLRIGVPADLDTHLTFFREELEILQPKRIVALGKLAHDLLARHLPEVRPFLGQMWHFSYAVRSGRLIEWEKSARIVISGTVVPSSPDLTTIPAYTPRRLTTASFGNSGTTGRLRAQRDVMRDLFILHRGDRELTISAYAAAERNGESPRESNTYSRTSEQYAKALLRDGLRRGWLRLS